VVPTFNYKLRTAKPVMLYWLQRASYAAFGVSEWAARLPSVLATWLTALLVYELARRMFDRPTGLLSGVVLLSALEVCVLAHAATRTRCCSCSRC
jgi:4-amino-4-deoxy-L-arabinose transferase-like glycosyltransferase